MIDSYTILQLAEASGVVLVGLGSAFFSRKAASNSKPVANGWVEGLGRRLDRQDAMLERVEYKLDLHIRDHAFPGKDPK